MFKTRARDRPRQRAAAPTESAHDSRAVQSTRTRSSRRTRKATAPICGSRTRVDQEPGTVAQARRDAGGRTAVSRASPSREPTSRTCAPSTATGTRRTPIRAGSTSFAEFLSIPVVTVLLVVIGFTGLILELKVPGLTVPGIIAALCFILVFWAQSQVQRADVRAGPAAVPAGAGAGRDGDLRAAGVRRVRDLRYPVHAGRPGAGHARQDSRDRERVGRISACKVSQYLFAMMGAMVLAFSIAKFLPKVPYANRMILKAPNDRTETRRRSAARGGRGGGVARRDRDDEHARCDRPAW